MKSFTLLIANGTSICRKIDQMSEGIIVVVGQRMSEFKDVYNLKF